MAPDRETPKRWLLQGVVITLPLVVTLLVLLIVLDFLLGVLSPFVGTVAYLWPDEPSEAFIQLTTVLSLLAFFMLVGVIADLTPGEHVVPVIDRAMVAVPGVSTIYSSVRRVSDMLVDDNEQFQDVRLIEFPHQKAYMLCFLIGETPPVIVDRFEAEEMLTVMVPLGPNPTTNGFVMHMPPENVHEVDMGVEEAAQSIATLGVAEVRMGHGER